MSASSGSRKYTCVIFDLGGVVLDSPIHVIARYERELLTKLQREQGNRPSLNKLFAASIHFQRLERGEYKNFTDFTCGFDTECRENWNLPVDTKEIFTRINQVEPRKVMVEAIQKLRQNGYTVGAITNNWQPDKHQSGISTDKLNRESLFEVVIESSLVGVRKPNPKIYRMALSALKIDDPTKVVFLDDIGKNLKPAAEMGIKTIKVHNEYQALRDLSAVLNLPLLSAADEQRARL